MVSFDISSSMLYSIVIAVVYLINIKYQYKITKLIKRLILIISILISLTISLSPIAFNKIDATEKSCGYRTEKGGEYWLVVCNFLTVFVGVIVIPITYTVLIYHLIKKKRELNKTNIKLNRSGLDISYYTLYRLALYPLVPIIAHGVTIYLSIGALLGISIDSYSVHILSLILTFFSSIQGLINSILYLTNSIFLKEINVLTDKLFGSDYYKSL
ncbi:hypothetical protein K502DRAFT_353785 [Neoconidiobolus thromboides FSU 785]|nr:hypothetical protein K502DRAFT_353785 [Neoconidiobolus thromboides FSU 785]